MDRLLVSACLLGFNCKYTGGNNRLGEETLSRLREKYRLVPVCPELSGGLSCPRPPAERQGERVMAVDVRDVTEEYRRGADTAVALYRRFRCAAALMKARSPSCGRDEIYDGSFTGTVIPGHGVAAEALLRLGAAIADENHVEDLF